jgi:hypothetical protein
MQKERISVLAPRGLSVTQCRPTVLPDLSVAVAASNLCCDPVRVALVP